MIKIRFQVYYEEACSSDILSSIISTVELLQLGLSGRSFSSRQVLAIIGNNYVMKKIKCEKLSPDDSTTGHGNIISFYIF